MCLWRVEHEVKVEGCEEVKDTVLVVRMKKRRGGRGKNFFYS